MTLPGRPERFAAMREAVAAVTGARGAEVGCEPPFPMPVSSKPIVFAHAAIALAVMALREVDRLGGDGDEFLRHQGKRAAVES